MASERRGGDYRWRKIARAQRDKGLPCFHCGMPINYKAKRYDPDSFSADHRKPWVRHPELRYDPGNVVSSHLRCNQSKGDREHELPGLGLLSEVF